MSLLLVTRVRLCVVGVAVPEAGVELPSSANELSAAADTAVVRSSVIRAHV